MDITVRNQKTGQASGDSKIARLSDLESSALQAINADYSLKELLSARADSQDAKSEMYKNISMYGYVSQEDLPSDIKNKQTLNTVSQYLLGAGIENDLLFDYNALDILTD